MNFDEFTFQEENEQAPVVAPKKYTIEIQVTKRTTYKSQTTVKGLDIELFGHDSYKPFLKDLRTKHNCSCAVRKDDNVLVASGNQAENIKKYLLEKTTLNESDITIHSFM